MYVHSHLIGITTPTFHEINFALGGFSGIGPPGLALNFLAILASGLRRSR